MTRATTLAVIPNTLSAELELRWCKVFDDHNGGDLHVLGEYRNLSARTITAPVLRLALMDEGGTLLETDELFPASEQLGPGQSGGFSGVVHLTRGAWRREQLIVCQTVLAGPADATSTLTLRDVVAIVATGAHLQIRGTIANNGGEPVDGVSVRAIISRAADDHFAGVKSTRLDRPLPAHGAAAFTLTASAGDMPGIEPGDAYTYRLEPRLGRAVGITCG